MYIHDMRTSADVPAVPINREELQPGDFIGTLHGIAVWEVLNVNQYVKWSSVRTTLISTANPKFIGTENTLTLANGSATMRYYRPLINV